MQRCVDLAGCCLFLRGRTGFIVGGVQRSFCALSWLWLLGGPCDGSDAVQGVLSLQVRGIADQGGGFHLGAAGCEASRVAVLGPCCACGGFPSSFSFLSPSSFLSLRFLCSSCLGQHFPLSCNVLPLKKKNQQAAWAAYPEGSTAQLWNALRLSWLFALWTTHSRADPSERHAHAVVAATVSSMITTIRSVFCRCLPGPLIFHVLPPNILTRQLKEQELSDFTMVWARNNVLCQVEQDGAGIKHLRVWLSMLHPVPAPLPPPPPVRAVVQMQ